MNTSEFDEVFQQLEAPDYPATCDKCGVEGTNASMEEHVCGGGSEPDAILSFARAYAEEIQPRNESSAPRTEESDHSRWRYEYRPGQKYPDLGMYTILAPNPDAGKEGVVYAGKEIALADTDDQEIAEQIVIEHNQHSTLLAQRERLLESLIKMRDKFHRHTCKMHGPMVCDKCELLSEVETTITTVEQEGKS